MGTLPVVEHPSFENAFIEYINAKSTEDQILWYEVVQTVITCPEEYKKAVMYLVRLTINVDTQQNGEPSQLLLLDMIEELQVLLQMDFN